VEVIAPGPDHTYRTIFQNAGRQIERRYGPPASRVLDHQPTYDEKPGEATSYATTVYRFENGKYVETTRK